MTPGSVVTMAKRIELSNEDFLKIIFGSKWGKAHVTSFKEDPANLDNLGLRHNWAGNYASLTLKYCLGSRNTYFAISLFEASDDHKARRRKDLHKATYVIVIDDVIEKVNPEKLKNLPPPSYILETSPGNEQWGYILEVPETNQARVDALLDGLVASGIADDGRDPGMKGVTRYVRLPVGSNTKAKYKEVFLCKLTLWEPSRVYRLEDLARPFSIDVANIQPKSQKYGAGIPETLDPVVPLLSQLGIFKGKVKPDTYDVECPWMHEHSGAADTGSAYLSPFGFRCHHGHCDDRHFGDLLDHIDAQLPGAKRSVEWARMVHEFDEDNRWPFEIASTWKTKEDIADHAGWLDHLSRLDPLSYDRLIENWKTVQGVPGSAIIDIQDAAETQRQHEDTGGMECLHPDQWIDREPPDFEWLIKDWLPKGKVTALYGDGGIGKTLLAQMLATCLAQDIGFLGEQTSPCKVLCIFCEDDADEIWRRQQRINAHYFVGMKDFSDDPKIVSLGAFKQSRRLRLISREGKDNILMTFNKGPKGEKTDFWHYVKAIALEFGADLIIFDTLADIFGGNEIIRSEARAFVQRGLLGLAIATDSTVLVLAHPSQAGKSSGQGYSGSTAWNNTFRARWYLSMLDDDPLSPSRNRLRKLSLLKSNYSISGPETDKILEWAHGAFRLVRSASDGEINKTSGRFQSEIDLEHILVKGIKAAKDNGIALSHAKNQGDLWAAKWCHDNVDLAAVKGYSEDDIARQLRGMLASGQLVSGDMGFKTGDGRHDAKGLIYVPPTEPVVVACLDSSLEEDEIIDPFDKS